MALITIFIHIYLIPIYLGTCSSVLGKERRLIGCGHERRVAEVENTIVYIPTIQHLLNNDALIAEVKWTVLKAYCLMLEINEFRCYEAKIEESEKAASRTQDTSGLSRHVS